MNDQTNEVTSPLKADEVIKLMDQFGIEVAQSEENPKLFYIRSADFEKLKTFRVPFLLRLNHNGFKFSFIDQLFKQLTNGKSNN